MRQASLLFALAFSAGQAFALPTANQAPASDVEIGVGEDVVLFDALAVSEPNTPGNILVSLEAYVTADSGGHLASRGLLSDITNMQSRMAAFASTAVAGKVVQVGLQGCPTAMSLPPTSAIDTGMASATLSFERCTGVSPGRTPMNASVVLGPGDPRHFVASVYNFPSSGFAVISDIDDTVKNSYVMDPPQLLKTTFMDNPVAVTNMPQLYSHLATLNAQFVYVSCSPVQIYPLLKGFLTNNFADANGPIFLRNLTTHNTAQLSEFIINNKEAAFTHKADIISKLTVMYMGKPWLMIGDSTEKDPEAYGDAYRKNPASVLCIWIRQVVGAVNTEDRFAKAFEGVPAQKYKIFTDADIPGLQTIDVANGKCN